MSSFNQETWNIRDSHMVETLELLMQHHKPETKVIIWEHNTHIGDARATNMMSQGLHNVGQLVRERHHEEGVFLVGFGSYEGTVIAGKHWGAEMEKMPVPEAIPGSIEHQLHKQINKNALFLFDEEYTSSEICEEKIGHRAIGVVYHPENENGNYVSSHMCDRYDAFLFFDKSQALHPLKISANEHKTPETYPFGI